MVTGLVRIDPARGSRRGRPGIEALADTLAALVAGVAAGVVGDAVVIAPVPGDSEVAHVAEATGATLVIVGPGEDAWRAGAGAARRSWCLCLAAGDVPREGWLRAVDRFVAQSDGAARAGTAAGAEPAIGRLGVAGASWRDALRERSSRALEAWGGARRVREGDLAPRALLLAGLPFPGRAPVRRLPALLDRGA